MISNAVLSFLVALSSWVTAMIGLWAAQHGITGLLT